jgi:hypothetical protein
LPVGAGAKAPEQQFETLNDVLDPKQAEAERFYAIFDFCFNIATGPRRAGTFGYPESSRRRSTGTPDCRRFAQCTEADFH